MVVYAPRRGIRVVDLSIKDLQNIYQFRIMTELFAIENIKDNGLKILKEAVSISLDSGLRYEDMSPDAVFEYREKIISFHIKLIETLDNVNVKKCYLWQIASLARYHFLQFATYGVTHSLGDHERLYDLIEGQRIDDAKELMKEHLNWSFQTLRTIVLETLGE
jgi:DNA-binding GntR family transcriptional regulator